MGQVLWEVFSEIKALGAMPGAKAQLSAISNRYGEVRSVALGVFPGALAWLWKPETDSAAPGPRQLEKL